MSSVLAASPALVKSGGTEQYSLFNSVKV